mmetsp:Transcript_55941/g.104964  ORF Transcript_55941/g.104964 Transcript_55941/m.104964 type:complete len:185 (+) Transcript_55941:85-639(+)
MALRTLVACSLVVLGSAQEDPLQAFVSPSFVDAEGKQESGAPTSWDHFVYCSCGLSCKEEVGSWYVFSIGKSCGCIACPEVNTSLRGSSEKSAEAKAADVAESLKVAEASAPEKVEEAPQKQDKAATEAPSGLEQKQEKMLASWDSAHVPSTKLLYCRCGKRCVRGRTLGLWNYWCFEWGCRTC